MTPEEIKSAFLPELEKTKEALTEMTKKSVKSEVTEQLKEVQELINGIKGLPEGMKAEDVLKMKSDLEATISGFDSFQKDYKEKSVSATKSKTWKAELIELYNEKKAEIEGIIKSGKQSGPLVFDLKDAVTMGDFNTIEAVGSASHYTLTENTGIISTIRKRLLTYLQNVSVSNMAKPYAMWIEELDEQGSPIFIGEGDTKTPLSVRYEERQAVVKKIAVYGKATTEMMDDLPQLIGYIQTNLMKRTDIKTEDQLIAGDNSGDNLNGIKNYATAFTGSTLAGTVPNPNNFDVINAAVLQVKKAFGIATGFFIDEGYLAQMKATKTTYGEYVEPSSFMTTDAEGYTTLYGVRLIGTNALTGTGIDFVGGDLSVINVRFRQGMRVQIGIDGNDFINNKKTILLEQRLVQFVSANDTQVLVKGTFSAAKALLDSGS